MDGSSRSRLRLLRLGTEYGVLARTYRKFVSRLVVMAPVTLLKSPVGLDTIRQDFLGPFLAQHQSSVLV